MTEEVKYPCPHCGKEHAPEVLYCPIYGEPIPTRLDPLPGETIEPLSAKDPNRVYVYIGIAALIMFALGFALLLRKPPKQQPPVVSSSTIPVNASVTPQPTEFSALPSSTQVTPPTATLTPTLTPTETPTLTSTPTVFAATWRPCNDEYLISRLHREMVAAVGGTEPLPNRVRENPGTDSIILGRIQPGEKVLITDGPECANNWVWWKIKSLETDLNGWTAEGDKSDYWLYPVEPTSTR
ncbi:MAG TPA: SH3 domain-containing protein [Bellilinea sp.]|nr:SH3 domain-containing protein [Bellilinea sp.]